MKPFGCKRTEPASPRRANSRSVSRARPVTPVAWRARSAGRIFRPVSGRRDSLGAGRRARAAVRGGGAFGRRPVANPGAPGRLARRQEPSTRPRRRRGPVGRRRVSGYFPTRLETRTKESNVCASQRCRGRRLGGGPSSAKTTFGAMKVIHFIGRWPGDRTRWRSESRRSAVRGRLRRVGFGRPGAHP